MKKLLIPIFSILISFNSYGDSSDETICVEKMLNIEMALFTN
ncbi:hypothetical protein OAV81_04880 [Candidatus Thioglobus sp.]|nr:hypothetical protein [Candidatus Thioglobus sp.]MDC3316060.1 hypothetical protein [Candidatus Thioglobus sp.]